VANALRDARALASSQTQLRMLDRVSHMIADELSNYKKFRAELFHEKAQTGYGVFLDHTLEKNE